MGRALQKAAVFCFSVVLRTRLSQSCTSMYAGAPQRTSHGNPIQTCDAALGEPSKQKSNLSGINALDVSSALETFPVSWLAKGQEKGASLFAVEFRATVSDVGRNCAIRPKVLANS